METLLSPAGGLAGVFVASFLAATVVPFASEAILFGYLKLHPDQAVLAVALATLGNTAGGMTTYLLGRQLPARTVEKHSPRAVWWIARYGSPVLIFAWLPILGDALCAGAGWLRMHWLPALGFMALGRLMRYVLISQL